MVRISPFSRAYLRMRAGQRMEDTVEITRNADPVLNRATLGTTRATGTTVYTGIARVWQVPAGDHVLMGDEILTRAQTMLSIPWEAPVLEMDDVVEVLTSTDDFMAGKTLTIVGTVKSGGLRYSRQFSARVVESKKVTW